MSGHDEAPDAPPATLLEESAEDLYENAPCGYISALPGGLIVRANQTFLTWMGYRREDLVGRRRFQDLLTAGGRIFHETHYAPLLQMQGSVREIAVEMVCADGRRLPALINSVLRRDEAGKPLLVRTTVFNATDRKEYERELLRERQKAEQTTQAMADFISMLSHEIRTPLSAIMGVGPFLGLTELSPQQQKLVRILRSSSENLLNLVNQILDFGKIEAGKVSLEERSFDLRQLVYGILDGLRIKTKEGVALEAHIDERVPNQLLGDPVKIGQVLTNLLANAIKFTPQGSVTVTLQVRELIADGVSIELPGRRHRDRDRRGPAAPHLRRLHPGQLRHRYEIRRHRPRAGHQQKACGDARQPDHRGERVGAGDDLPLRPAPEDPTRCR